MKKKLITLLVVLSLCCMPLLLMACSNGDEDKYKTTDTLSLSSYAMSYEAAEEADLIDTLPSYTRATENVITDTPIRASDNSSFELYHCYFVRRGIYVGLYNGALKEMVVEPNYYNGYTVVGDLIAWRHEIIGQADFQVRVITPKGTILVDELKEITVSNYTGKATSLGFTIKYTISYTNDDDIPEWFVYYDKTDYVVGKIDSAPTYQNSTYFGYGEERLLEQFEDAGYDPEKTDTVADRYTLSLERAHTGGLTILFRIEQSLTRLVMPRNTAMVYWADNKITYVTRQFVPEGSKLCNLKVKTLDVSEWNYYQVKVFSFDVPTGKTTELTNLGYIPMEITPLYNYDEGMYDAYVVKALPTKNGVATDAGIDGLAYKTFVTDNMLQVGADMSAFTEFDSADSLVRLSNDRVLLVDKGAFMAIVDARGEMVFSVKISSTPKVVSANEIIVLSRSDVFSRTLYGAIDYDGKIAMPFIYESLNFYGKNAMTTVYESDGTSKTEQIVSPNNYFGASTHSFYELDVETNTIDMLAPGLVFAINSEFSTCTIFNYNGDQLRTIDSNSISFELNTNFEDMPYLRLEYQETGSAENTVEYLILNR